MSRSTNSNPRCSFIQVIALIALFTSGLLWPSISHADEKKEATLKVVRDGDCYERIKLRVNGDVFGPVRQGETKSFTFEPDASGTTKIKLTSYDVFGGENWSRDIAAKVVPGGVVRLNIEDNIKYKTTVDNPAPKVVAPAPAKAADVKVEFEENVIDKELFTESIEIVAGVKAKYKLERAFKRSMTTTLSSSIEASVSGKTKVDPIPFVVSAEVEAGLKTTIGASLGIMVGSEETFSQEIEVDGDKTPKLKVIWVHRYRKGTTTIDGKTVEVLICVGVRWKLQKD